MKINRRLLCSGLIAAMTFSVLAFPSPGSRSSAAPAKAQDPIVTGQLVQGQTRDEELSRHFRKYDLIRMDPARAAAQVRSKGKLLIKSSAGDFDLQLTPHDMRSADYTAQVIDAARVVHFQAGAGRRIHSLRKRRPHGRRSYLRCNTRGRGCGPGRSGTGRRS